MERGLKSEAARSKTRKINAAIGPDVKRFSHQIKRTRFSVHTPTCVGSLSSSPRTTMAPGFTTHSAKTLRSIERSSASVALPRGPFSAAFTTNIAGFDLRHTG